jgi:hypothetical protein
MTARRKKEPSLLAGRKATVVMERNGLSIRVDDVEADKAGLVAADLLMAFRLLRSKFPELIAELQPVGGGYPLDVTDDDWSEEGKRAGFRMESRR